MQGNSEKLHPGYSNEATISIGWNELVIVVTSMRQISNPGSCPTSSENGDSDMIIVVNDSRFPTENNRLSKSNVTPRFIAAGGKQSQLIGNRRPSFPIYGACVHKEQYKYFPISSHRVPRYKITAVK